MHRLRRALATVRDFLLSSTNKEFLIFLFFLALSSVFWLMKTLDQTYEQEYPVCVRLTGVPDNVVMTTDLPDTVRVTVRDKGFQLLSYSISHPFHPIVLNFNAYANKQAGHGQVPLTDLQKYVRKQLYNSSTMVSLKADGLEFYFNYGRNKRVKVLLQGNIVPAKNYYLAHAQCSPERVTVYASKEALADIETVSTEYLNIVNFEDTVTRTVRLKTAPGVKVVPQAIRVTLYPDILTEGTKKVPITPINLPEGIVLRTFPQYATVRFTVGAKSYRLVTDADFQVFVDYREVARRPSDKCTLHLRNRSRYTTKARLDTNQVDYLIEQQ